MTELPRGWTEARLSDICVRIVDGSHNPPKGTPAGFPMLSARNIQARQIVFDDFRFISDVDFAVEDARTNVSPGDVLLTIVGTIGRTAVVPPDATRLTLQRSVAVLKPSSVLDSRFIAYVLESPDVQRYFEENAKGTAQKGIYLRTLGLTEIPLPPLDEQRRIADKLDTLLARVDACRDRLNHVLPILKGLEQSLINGISPKNTPPDWVRTKFRDLVSDFKSGTSDVPSDDSTRLPVLRSSAVRTMSIDFSDIRYLDDTSSNEKYLIKENDLLFTRLSGSLDYVGNCARVPAIGELKISISDRTFLARLKDPTLASYLEILFATQQLKDKVTAGIKSSAGHKRISMGDILNREVLIPPPKKRRKIIRTTQHYLSVIRVIGEHISTAESQVLILTEVLLAKAFRGELVPQDPNDEPASVLLERIRAEKARAPAKQRRRKPRESAEAPA